jgi:hypothetical protein
MGYIFIAEKSQPRVPTICVITINRPTTAHLVRLFR